MGKSALREIVARGLKEVDVKKQVVSYLKTDWVVKTIFTGGIPTGAKLVSNPCKGIPDLICFHKRLPVVLWIELKREKGGVVSPEQKHWHELLRTRGQLIIVANSVEFVRNYIEEHLIEWETKILAA